MTVLVSLQMEAFKYVYSSVLLNQNVTNTAKFNTNQVTLQIKNIFFTLINLCYAVMYLLDRCDISKISYL